MSIPIRNLYYLLCYAWDSLEQLDRIDVGHLDAHDVANLLGRVLAHGVQDLIRRGLDREYVEQAEDVAGVKGRIDFARTASRLLLPMARTHCRYDDLSIDVLQNRILRETIRRLSTLREVAGDTREDLKTLYLRMEGVSYMRISSHSFGRVRVHRNNAIYRFLLELCRLIGESTLVDEEGNVSRFVDFSRDEGMSMLFEKFIRRFLQKHADTGTTVRRRVLPWQKVHARPTEAERHLPYLETDVVLESAGRTLVVDAKYYQAPLKGGRNSDRRSVIDAANINQMFVYVSNIAETVTTPPVEGLILYAATDDLPRLRDEFELHGKRIRVATLSLAQEWQSIHRELLELVSDAGQSTRASDSEYRPTGG